MGSRAWSQEQDQPRVSTVCPYSYPRLRAACLANAMRLAFDPSGNPERVNASWGGHRFLYHPNPRSTALRAASLLAGPGQDARLHQFLREGGKVGLGAALGWDLPDITEVRAARDFRSLPTASVLPVRIAWTSWGLAEPVPRSPFPDRLIIVKVFRSLAQQEHLLMSRCGPIRHALGHRVRLVPDDL